LSQLKNILDSASTILVIHPSQTSFDHRAVAASLYLAFSAAQKSVRLVSPQIEERTDASLIGIEQTQIDMGNQNLGISFAYSPEQVDKVSYHIGEDTGKFYLTIKPKAGFPPLDASQVEFTYTGAVADAVFLVGVTDLESLEQLYFGYEDLFKTASLVSINNFTTSFGTVKIDSGSVSSSSEVIAQLLQNLGISIESEVATNLLAGIENSTQNLSSVTTSAETFEVVAQLIRFGARRNFKKNSQEKATPVETDIGFTVEGGLREPEKNNKSKIVKPANKKNSISPPPEFSPSKRI
jgi:hypothetical protein